MKIIISVIQKSLYFATIFFLLMACSRSTVPLSVVPTSEVIADITAITPQPTETAVPFEKYPLQREYAAVWVSKEEGLVVRSEAGISATGVEILPWDSRQIYLTGNRSLLGSSLWVEININGGITGWVNAWNISEYTPSSQFCEDGRVIDLLDQFQRDFRNHEESALRELISPNRGLTLRLNWYSPDITFSYDKVDSMFTDETEYDWGMMADSGLQIVGPVSEIIQPKVEDVFSGSAERLCNELKWGNTAGEVLWPEELKNLNFYAFYRPAVESGNLFDWRTLAVGIEYVNHQPFIAILVHYSSEL